LTFELGKALIVASENREDSMPHSAFVAGATGYTGTWVVKHLLNRGIKTIAHVRPDSSHFESWHNRFEKLGATVDGTPWDEQAMAETLHRNQPAVVFALLGTTRARKKSVTSSGGDPNLATYEAVDYGLTSLLIRAIVSAKINPHVVYLSAIGVSETSSNEYYRARWKVEAELSESGLTYTIARPSFITGPDRPENRIGEKLGAAVLDGALFAIGALGAKKVQGRYRSLSGELLGLALVESALSEACKNRVLQTGDLRRMAVAKSEK
jgi:nucleoside-diphosphate-sugar epimerase